MTATTQPTHLPATHGPEKAITLALSLADAERAIHAFASDQVDAIVDADGRAYLLRPAQERLRQNESRLHAIIEGAADVITVVSRGGLILSQNRAVTRVLGYGQEELVGSSFFDRIHEEDLGAAYAAFFDIIEGFHEDGATQFRHQASDGSWRAIEATVGTLRDASPASVVFCLRAAPENLPRHTDPNSPGAPEVAQAGGEREFILLSHGRQIPFMGPRLATDGLDESLGIGSAKAENGRKHE